ncbi:hypothetical protein [Flavobacterium sp. 3HN19-14]
MKKPNKDALLLIPIFGVLAFMVIYFTATLYYPGGSQANLASVGFS